MGTKNVLFSPTGQEMEIHLEFPVFYRSNFGLLTAKFDYVIWSSVQENLLTNLIIFMTLKTSCGFSGKANYSELEKSILHTVEWNRKTKEF